MNDTLPNHSTAGTPPDARKFERKRIPLSAKVTDHKGMILTDGTIVDLSLVGAQISLPTTQPIPNRVYVVELTNGVAYEANVAWWRPGSAGLAFQNVYPLDENLPQHLEFMKHILIDTKLQQIEALTSDGRSLAEAVQMAGVTVTMYARWNSERFRDDDLAHRLWELEAENASLRKLLAEMTRDPRSQASQRTDSRPTDRAAAG